MSKEILELKKKEVEVIKEKIAKSKGFVLVDYRGLTVAQDTEMRVALRASNIEYKVIKNRLALRAIQASGYEGFDEALNGPTAIAFGYDDAIAPAKIICDSIDKYRKMTVKGAVIESKVIEAEKVKAYAQIPSKPILIAQLLGMLQNPIRSLAVALSEIAKKQA